MCFQANAAGNDEPGNSPFRRRHVLHLIENLQRQRRRQGLIQGHVHQLHASHTNGRGVIFHLRNVQATPPLGHRS